MTRIERAREFLKSAKPGYVALRTAGAIAPRKRHGDCHCCRWFQFLSDATPAGEIEMLSGQKIMICEFCVSVANRGES